MSTDNKKYSVVIYSENIVGQISKLSNMLSRRNLNIISFKARPTDIPDISMITIVTEGSEKNVRQATLGCESNIDVAKAFSVECDLIESPDESAYDKFQQIVKDILK